MYKTIYLLLVALVLNNYSQAQPIRLKERLDSLLTIMDEKKIERMVDFMNPKIFETVTREQFIKKYQFALVPSLFMNDEDEIWTVDSVKLKTIFPLFTIKDEQYAKIYHTRRLLIQYKEMPDSIEAEKTVARLKVKFGEKNVRIDKEKKRIITLLNLIMVAAKNKYSTEWTFVDGNTEDPIIGTIFGREVLEKLREYK